MAEPAEVGDSGGAQPPLVSAIVPARNAAATLERALRALRDQQLDASFEVIVVDDGSSDETGEIAARQGPLVTVLRNQPAQGPGAARNRGVAAARGRVLAFTDADCFPAPDWLARGVEAIREADIVQGAVIPDPTVPRTPFERTLQVDRPSGFFQTANLFVRREVFDAVGGFRDWSLDRPGRRGRRRGFANHTPPGEDALFGWSARRMGASTRFAPEVSVHHAVFPSTVAGVIADRWHWTRDMPGLAKLVPELRRVAFHRRFFFSIWTMNFDFAALGVLGAIISRRKFWLILAVPYLRWCTRQARRWGRRDAPAVALGSAAIDAATLAGLVVGSVTWRSLVL